MEWAGYVTPFISPAIMFGILYFITNGMRSRIKELETAKLSKEVFEIVNKEIKDSVDDVKEEQKTQHDLLIQIANDIKWIKANGERS